MSVNWVKNYQFPVFARAFARTALGAVLYAIVGTNPMLPVAPYVCSMSKNLIDFDLNDATAI